jgi:hypothetical protein
VPRFQTWYDREDVSRLFQRLYGTLDRDDRMARVRFTDAALDDAFGWNARFVTTLPEWPAERLAMYAASLDRAAAIAGASGLQRVAMSPDAVRHLVMSYPEVLRCVSGASLPAGFVDATTTSQRMAREALSLTRCASTMYGPYFVASGAELTARVTELTDDAVLRIHDGVSPTAPVRCSAGAAMGCSVRGPGTFTVRVHTRERPASGMLDVRYATPNANVAGCLNGVFPPSAASVAIEWRRADFDPTLPVYDTSAAGLARRLAPGANATWGDGDRRATPDANAIYAMRAPAGTNFRLAAMHIRTRELDHWLNITLWWSPNPDEDFGADRPAEIRALGGPWSSYKMCVATDFEERDRDPSGGYANDAPSLAAALRAVYERHGGPSWCSNPYIDAAPGLVRSNCVGCHQHALSGVRSAEVQNDLARYPHNGRMQVRNNFPSDGFWGIDAGDRLGAVFAETIDYWRSAP